MGERELSEEETRVGWAGELGLGESGPGTVSFDSQRSELVKNAHLKLRENPGILDLAKRKGKDIVAFMNRNRGKLVIAASAVIFAGIGGKIIYDHRQEAGEEKSDN